ncbi:hypothetical protein Btru_051332 [Bulinus truncatus]|nr:hypothetical protein Btru_051332 [Bulinus truncatus]
MSRTPIRIFIISMAVCDLLTKILLIPAEMYDTLQGWTFSSILLCKVRYYMNSLVATTTGYLLVAVSFTRYKKVCCSVDQQVTITQAKLMTTVLFIISLVVSSHVVMVNGIQKLETPIPGIFGSICDIDEKYITTIWPTVSVSMTFVLFCVGFSMIVIFYVLIGRKTWKHGKTLKDKKLNCNIQADHMLIQLTNLGSLSRYSRSDLQESGFNETMSMSGTLDRNESVDTSVDDTADVKPESFFTSALLYKHDTTDNINVIKSKPSLVVHDYSTHKCTSNIKQCTCSDNSDEVQVIQSSRDMKLNTNLAQKSKRKKIRYVFNNSSEGKISQGKISQGKIRQVFGKTTCMMLTLSIFILIGYLPMIAAFIFRAIYYENNMKLEGVPLALYHLCFRSHFINCAVNPIVYSFMDRRFRMEAIKLVQCSIIRKV